MKPGRIIAIIVIAAVAGLAWLLMHTPRQAEEEEQAVQTQVTVHAAKLERMTLHRYVSAYGVVEPRPAGNEDPGGRVELSAPVSGLVQEVMCSEGERVEAGEILVQLDTRPIDVQIERAREQLRFAEQQYERQQKLLEIDGTSQRAEQEALEARNVARDQLSAAQTERALLQITAPFSGIVARIWARPGQSVDLSSMLIELVDPNNLVITAGIPAGDVRGLRAGAPVKISGSDDTPAARGTLMFLSPQIDASSGTALARVSVPTDAQLYAGQYVSIDIQVEERPDRLAAPVESVVTGEGGETVVAVINGDTAVQVPVETGLRDGSWIEIEGDDLEAGDLVVTVGAFGLPSETAVSVVSDGN